MSLTLRRVPVLALLSLCGLAAPAGALAAPGDVVASYTDDLYAGAYDYGVAAASDVHGWVYVAGVSFTLSPVDHRMVLARYTESGLDASFANGGKRRLDVDVEGDIQGFFDHVSAQSWGNDMLVHNSGTSQRVLVAGWAGTEFNKRKPLVAAFRPDGQNDTTWSGDGVAVLDVPNASRAELRGIARQRDGKIVVAGNAYVAGRQHAFVARFTAQGVLDRSFSSDGMYTTLVKRAVSGQADGVQVDDVVVDGVRDRDRIVVVGSAFYWGPPYDQAALTIALRGDGTPDASWGGDGTVDGFTRTRGGVQHVDFGTGKDEMTAAALQRDGKVVLVGYREVELTPSPNLSQRREAITARLLPTGSLDTSYGGGDGITEWRETYDVGATGVALTSSRILVSVHDRGVPTVPGSPASGDDTFTVVSYTPDGEPDPTWGPAGGVVRTNLNLLQPQGGGYEAVHSVTALPNGRIAVAGITWPEADDYRYAVVFYSSP